MVEETSEQRRERKKRLKVQKKARKAREREKVQAETNGQSKAENGLASININSPQLAQLQQNGDAESAAERERAGNKDKRKRKSHNRVDFQENLPKEKRRAKRIHDEMANADRAKNYETKVNGAVLKVKGDHFETRKKRRRKSCFAAEVVGTLSEPQTGGDAKDDVSTPLDLSELLGPAAYPLLSPKEVQELSPQAQKSYIDGVTDLSSRVLHSLDELLATMSQYEMNATLEEMVLADMARTKKLPLYKSFRETTLWRRVARTTGLAGEMAEAALGKDDESKDQLIETYLQDITSKCENELQELREKEEMSAEKVKFLLRCLRAGATAYANIKLGP